MTTPEEYLKAFRTKHGEDAWSAEVRRLALHALRTGSTTHEAYWRNLTREFEWLDWEQLKAQAQSETLPPDAQRLIAETLKSQMPGIRSQAQYDAVVRAMEAVQIMANALLERNQAREEEARVALEASFDAIRKTTEMTLKLQDVPEAASSEQAQPFKDEPAQFHEVDIQRALLKELDLITTIEQLRNWYEAIRDRRDKILSHSLRNALFDAVRAKRKALS